MSANEPELVTSVLGILLEGVLGRRAASKRREAARLAMELAVKEAREQERRSQQQQRQWRDEVQRQMSRGRAGDASPQSARDALGGRGGRRSELDDRWFP
jgi:hypothetical protein